MPKNMTVKILKRKNGWIRVSPLTPLPPPRNLARFKAELGARWRMTSLLDVLKETELRVHFTEGFTNLASRETLPRDVLQKRLLLCLYGLGTNIGLKRLADADPGTTYDDSALRAPPLRHADNYAPPSLRRGQRHLPCAPTRRSGARAPRPAPRIPRSSAPGIRT